MSDLRRNNSASRRFPSQESRDGGQKINGNLCAYEEGIDIFHRGAGGEAFPERIAIVGVGICAGADAKTGAGIRSIESSGQ